MWSFQGGGYIFSFKLWVTQIFSWNFWQLILWLLVPLFSINTEISNKCFFSFFHYDFVYTYNKRIYADSVGLADIMYPGASRCHVGTCSSSSQLNTHLLLFRLLLFILSTHFPFSKLKHAVMFMGVLWALFIHACSSCFFGSPYFSHNLEHNCPYSNAEARAQGVKSLSACLWVTRPLIGRFRRRGGDGGGNPPPVKT